MGIKYIVYSALSKSMSSEGTESHPWGNNNFHYCPIGWTSTDIGFQTIENLTAFKNELLKEISILTKHRDQMSTLMFITPHFDKAIPITVSQVVKGPGMTGVEGQLFEWPMYGATIQYHPNDQQVISLLHRLLDKYNQSMMILTHTNCDTATFSSNHPMKHHWLRT